MPRFDTIIDNLDKTSRQGVKERQAAKPAKTKQRSAGKRGIR